ncbi:MAG: hypothetical protein ACI9U2_001455, partial [Bradymonadia bacterium]
PRLQLINAVLAHRRAWGQVHHAGPTVYYTSKTGLAEAERSGLLE